MDGQVIKPLDRLRYAIDSPIGLHLDLLATKEATARQTEDAGTTGEKLMVFILGGMISRRWQGKGATQAALVKLNLFM